MVTLTKPQDFEGEVNKRHFSNPFDVSTQKIKRNLFVFSGFSIILKIYDLKVTSLPWLNIDIPGNAPNILEGILAIVVLYFFITFLFSVSVDFIRWSIEKDIDSLGWVGEHVKQAKRSADLLAQYPEINSDKISSAMKQIEDASQKVNRKIAYKNQFLASLSWVRIMVLEVCLPVILGLLSLVMIGTSSLDLIAEIWRYFF